MKWVLLWWVLAGQGNAIHSTEFNNEAACSLALESIRKIGSFGIEIRNGVCVMKGYEK